MTDQTPVLVRTDTGITGYWCTYVVTVSSGDNVRLRDLVRIQGATALKVADWSTVTLTYSGNTVTVTTAGLVTAPIVILAGGQK